MNYSWDTFLVAGYAKCAISFVKYVPQVYLNYKRKSTVGWSLGNVLLDLTGGLLSFAQIFLNALALGEPVIGAGAFNFVKFILSILSIFFDTIFLIQHYCLYSDSWKNAKKKGDGLVGDANAMDNSTAGALLNKTEERSPYDVDSSKW